MVKRMWLEEYEKKEVVEAEEAAEAAHNPSIHLLFFLRYVVLCCTAGSNLTKAALYNALHARHIQASNPEAYLNLDLICAVHPWLSGI